MAEFKVVHQDTPFNFTTPGVLIIDAPSRAEAFLVAVDCLTRRGHAVWVHVYMGKVSSGTKLSFDGADAELIVSRGINETQSGRTMICSIEPYGIKVSGKVLETEAI